MSLYGELWLKFQSLYGDQELTLNSFNVGVIYRIRTSRTFNGVIFSHPGEFKRDLARFERILKILPYSVIKSVEI